MGAAGGCWWWPPPLPECHSRRLEFCSRGFRRRELARQSGAELMSGLSQAVLELRNSDPNVDFSGPKESPVVRSPFQNIISGVEKLIRVVGVSGSERYPVYNPRPFAQQQQTAIDLHEELLFEIRYE